MVLEIRRQLRQSHWGLSADRVRTTGPNTAYSRTEYFLWSDLSKCSWGWSSCLSSSILSFGFEIRIAFNFLLHCQRNVYKVFQVFLWSVAIKIKELMGVPGNPSFDTLGEDECSFVSENQISWTTWFKLSEMFQLKSLWKNCEMSQWSVFH